MRPVVGGEVELPRRERPGVPSVVGGPQGAGDGEGGVGEGGWFPAGEEAEAGEEEREPSVRIHSVSIASASS